MCSTGTQEMHTKIYWCTRVAQKFLKHFLDFSQNQHEMSFPIHNFECSTFYHSAMEYAFSRMHRIVKIVWHCDMHFKQQVVIEFFVVEKE